LALVILSPDPPGLARLVECLHAGEVVGFPTDTVYGLAALASDERAVRRVFEIKGRPLSQPLILMVPEAALVPELAEVGERERAYMDRWWPGPLTLVLRAKPHLVAPLVSGEPPTVGVRIPDHPDALALLRAAGAPLATTSANRSGQPEALTAAEAAWPGGPAAVLDGGRAPGGVPSTLLDLSGPEPRILREGPIPADDLLAPTLAVWRRLPPPR
jgi:L-threonylcarbamoyladenylate synthase